MDRYKDMSLPEALDELAQKKALIELYRDDTLTRRQFLEKLIKDHLQQIFGVTRVAGYNLVRSGSGNRFAWSLQFVAGLEGTPAGTPLTAEELTQLISEKHVVKKAVGKDGLSHWLLYERVHTNKKTGEETSVTFVLGFDIPQYSLTFETEPKLEARYGQFADEIYEALIMRRWIRADELTGVLQRGPGLAFLDHRLDQLLCGEIDSIAFGFVDLVRMKETNDGFFEGDETASHDRGDAVLKYVISKLIACGIDPEDLLRYGGDEFVAFAAIELLRKAVEMMNETYTFEYKGIQVPASISVGYVVVTFDDAQRIKKALESSSDKLRRTSDIRDYLRTYLMTLADEAMYEAKNLDGRASEPADQLLGVLCTGNVSQQFPLRASRLVEATIPETIKV